MLTTRLPLSTVCILGFWHIMVDHRLSHFVLHKMLSHSLLNMTMFIFQVVMLIAKEIAIANRAGVEVSISSC